MDRQDIDALLVGALYGELTPADEARLTAHLESHPADRGALDDLKVARAAVRESRIFELQAEPPQAISALLLQEAHRRAPKRVVSPTGEEKESWFFRFTRMFMAHPAMAAAAMLVVVIGVFGIMQVNNRDAAEVADQTYSPSAQTETAGQAMTNEATVAPIGSAEPAAAAGSAIAMDPSELAPADEGGGGKDSYRVGLDEKTRSRDGFVADRERASKESAKLQREEQANKKSKGMIVTTPQPQPKELDAPRPKTATTKAPTKSSTLAKADYADDLDSGAVGTTGTASAGAGGAAAPRAGAGAGLSANTAAPSAPQGKFAQPTAPSAAPTAAAPAPPPPSVATSTPSTTSKPTTTKQAQEKPAESKAESTAATKDSSLIAWAKSEHNRTVALANKGDCIAAAKLAVVVQNRAPDYYTQFMSTDRALKRCQSYISQERDAEAERTGKARAQKRVNADEPAPTTTK